MAKNSPNVPHIPTQAQLIDEAVEEAVDKTLDLLDERLFYIYNKTVGMTVEEFQAFIKRGLKGFQQRVIDSSGDWA